MTQQRSALEDHEGHSSWSFFQLLFLLPLVNSFPCGGGIEPLQTFRGTLQALGCSPAMPSHLGPKSSRVTNANHKWSRVACSQFESHSTHKMDFASLNQSLTKRGLESVLKAQKRVRESVESAASKGGG